MSYSAKAPQNLGVRDGKLAACPESPNCVSTQAVDELHQMSPILVSDQISPADDNGVIQICRDVLLDFPRMKIIEEEDKTYLRAECRSLIFRFVDDVEVFFDKENKRIHFRSASRTGYSDMGVNKKRMEKFSQLVQERLSKLN